MYLSKHFLERKIQLNAVLKSEFTNYCKMRTNGNSFSNSVKHFHKHSYTL